ncbi:gamma-glutamyl-gamma-aminobutyrate hydrolase family protein [Streptomyces marincola]|uniref:gamma-glutamyl-gamma-aminobutyrate hydrolase family protein n=1 Tax=Streptomyces marincola TaxID=2878388 RepID=UPI001CF116B6|nr:gamma-glutamyl-gamma-aminobutyrate hydrolase family protein [Streptomyces marincola]UCM86893.1 gamma-glutamyl-gamma-aminobutyrate hydrolase family protein [Streptomyces marincola]
MRPPLIGVSTYLEDSVRWGVWHDSAALLPAGYHRLVRRAGGLAVLLPPDEAPAAVAAVTRLDGLVIAGGPDVDPACYGAARDPRTGPPAPERDRWELALIEAALDRRLPLLGVCRGMQLLNVALGGSLRQHVDGHAGPPGVFTEHEVRPVAGTSLAAVLPGPFAVTAYHHQAVDVLGHGLVASAFAPDGTVEAVELPVPGGLVLGVQWHPEAGGGPHDVAVMRALTGAATAGAARSPGVPGPAGPPGG